MISKQKGHSFLWLAWRILAMAKFTRCSILVFRKVWLRIGSITPLPGRPFGMEAKFRIADLLGIKINGVEKFRGKIGLKTR